MRYTVIIFITSCFFINVLHSQDELITSKPVFTSKAVSRIYINDLYSYHFAAFDSAGLSLSYSSVILPEWLQLDTILHIVRGKAKKKGQFRIQLKVGNGKNFSIQDFILTVYDQFTTNILCLGNSITNGTGKFNSYRRPLWQLLHRANYNFDMIGSWNKHHMGAEVPNPDFDADNDGHSGWTIENMFHPPDWDSARGNINQWLEIYKADIVLIELGTNDVFQCRSVPDMIKDLGKLTDILRNKNNKIKIFIAQIPPLGEQWAPKKLCGDSIAYREVIKELNKQIRIFAVKANTTASGVIVVDQFSGVDPAKDMYDDIHPNVKGEKIMAKRWFDAIRPYLKKLN
ncbi:MAG: SGNH/GDSL hydrolase family protein [Chitinophagaceae bacterium]